MEKLKIAIQKSGRLHDQSIEILKRCGISVDNGKDQLKAASSNFPLEIYYLRNGDIPQYLKAESVSQFLKARNIKV
jgi:ATP phosphoribosyltransferase